MQIALTAKNIQMLCHILIKRRPDLANEFLQECLEQMSAPVRDTSLIEYYFDSYCIFSGIEKNNFLSAKHDHAISQKRKEFIGFILKVYHPYVFSPNCDFFKPKNGLVTNLSKTLQMSKGNVSQAVQEVREWVKHYDEFILKINLAYDTIIGQNIAG